MPSGSKEEALKRIPLIEAELKECDNMIQLSYIEQDIAIYNLEEDSIKEILKKQINDLTKRREILKKLLEIEREKFIVKTD